MFPKNDNARFVFLPASFRATIADYARAFSNGKKYTSVQVWTWKDEESLSTRFYSYAFARRKYEYPDIDVYQVPRRCFSPSFACTVDVEYE